VRFFKSFGRFPFREIEPTPSEAFVQREFGEAIAFAKGEWERFTARFGDADPALLKTFTLAQRLDSFLAGPIGASLLERFPVLAATGAEADAVAERTGNLRVICRLIIGEAVIAAGGGSRGEVRVALAD
jgi:hypothetical protein